MSYPRIKSVKFESSGQYTNIPKQAVLGDAIRITAIVNLASADTAKITIDDSAETVKVDAVAMTKAADGVYTYILQSDEDWDCGTFIITIEISDGTNTATRQDRIELLEQD